MPYTVIFFFLSRTLILHIAVGLDFTKYIESDNDDILHVKSEVTFYLTITLLFMAQ